MNAYDVIIIGSGAAGLRAGVHFQENGLRSVVLEKRKTSGGNTRISDGGIAASETDFQRAAGLFDSPESMKADMLEAGLHKNDESLVDAVVQGAKEAFEWTRSIGVEYDGISLQFGGHSLPRCYTPVSVSGRTLVKKSEAAYVKLGGTLLTEKHVQRLLFEDGRVTGVRFQNKTGATQTLHASKGVLLTSGGFGADKTLLKSIRDAYGDLDTTNMKTATAEMLKSAIEIGADTVDLDEIQIAPWTSPKEKGFGHAPKFADYIALPKGIYLDPATSRRFVNELADRKRVADAILALKHPAIALADAKAVAMVEIDISKALKNGSVTSYDTLEAFAEANGLDASTLKETLVTFNRFVQSGEDEHFQKPLGNTLTIDTPPYYGMEVWPKVHYTMGGLRINTDGQVLDKNKTPIKGLYAAGEATGGVHGASRLGSCAITDALVMGKRAAVAMMR